jgi:DNA helicase INO80
VQLLLNNDQLASLDTSTTSGLSGEKGGKESLGEIAGEPTRDLWTDEGDDFFGHSGVQTSNNVTHEVEEDNCTPGLTGSRGKKRKATGSSRARKSGLKSASSGKKKQRHVGDAADFDV